MRPMVGRCKRQGRIYVGHICPTYNKNDNSAGMTNLANRVEGCSDPENDVAKDVAQKLLHLRFHVPGELGENLVRLVLDDGEAERAEFTENVDARVDAHHRLVLRDGL